MKVCPVCARPLTVSGCLGDKRNVIDYHEVCENCGKYSFHSFDGVTKITINKAKNVTFYSTKESLIKNNICDYGKDAIPEHRPSIIKYLDIYGLTMEKYKDIIGR